MTVRTLGAGGVSPPSIAGQLTMSVIIDQFGLLGVERTRSRARVGVLLLAAGTCSSSGGSVGRHGHHDTATRVLDNYVGGRWTAAEPREQLDVTNPATGEVLARVPLSPPADLDAAVAPRARRCPPGAPSP